MYLDSQGSGPRRNADIPGYDPAAHFKEELARAAEGRGIDITPFQAMSQQWWLTYTNGQSNHAPPPDQRMWQWVDRTGEINEKLKVGRLMDPYAAQCQMHTRKIEFANFVVGFILSVLGVGVGGLIGGGLGLPPMMVVGPLFILWLLMGWGGYRTSKMAYQMAFWAQVECRRTGHPQWVPYGWHQLHNIRRHQGRHGLDYTWP